MSVQVREVWSCNLRQELRLIQQAMLQFPLISMDTEFPGTIHPTQDPKDNASSSSSCSYDAMKKNVDGSNIIQLGLTLSHVDTCTRYVWEFNFRDFDPGLDPHNPESISLLTTQGIDFSKNKKHGIDSGDFARGFLDMVLPLNCTRVGYWTRTWTTFHGAYDFGYIIKILTGRELPDTLVEFTMLVQRFFGEHVFDVKVMGRVSGLWGGLNRMAESLKLCRVAGKSHQAGSDSLLTMDVFVELMRNYFGSCKIVGRPYAYCELLNYMICGYGLTPFESSNDSSSSPRSESDTSLNKCE